MAKVSKGLLLVDFNGLRRFAPSYFVTMDHLSEKGADNSAGSWLGCLGKNRIEKVTS